MALSYEPEGTLATEKATRSVVGRMYLLRKVAYPPFISQDQQETLRASNDMNAPSKLADSLSGMGADGSRTARVQRGESATARCASTEDHQAPSPPLFRE